MTSEELVREQLRLRELVDDDPAEAIRCARLIDTTGVLSPLASRIRSSILVDAGVQSKQVDAIREGLSLAREAAAKEDSPENNYQLAYAIDASIGDHVEGPRWLAGKELSRRERAESRNLYWRVANNREASRFVRSYALTNLANQLSHSWRFGEAHEARVSALELHPQNGTAALGAAADIGWLIERGADSPLARLEAEKFANIAVWNKQRIEYDAGKAAASQLSALVRHEPISIQRPSHTNEFLAWLELQRLALAPNGTLVSHTLDQQDGLVLPPLNDVVAQRSEKAVSMRRMFNILKADFMVARDLAWRATKSGDESSTAAFANTFDDSLYGVSIAAQILALRAALDLLDKIAVAANFYFDLGIDNPEKIYFRGLWREKAKGRKTSEMASTKLTPAVEKVLGTQIRSLYGLVELADDYRDKEGILGAQQELRNAGTHRFVLVHESSGSSAHFHKLPEEFYRSDKRSLESEMFTALRTARSALQSLTFAVADHEYVCRCER